MRIAKLAILLLAIGVINICNAHVVDGVSFLSPRSQSTNYAREIAGMSRYRIQTEDKEAQSYLNITPYYAHSVRGNITADVFFGCNKLAISGSMVQNRGPETLLADYFGLSPSFESVVQFEPHIQNALMIINGHWALDRWVNGLYFDLIAPFGWTQWHMELEETIINPGTDTDFPARYMAQNAVQAPIESFQQALSGNVRFGQMQDPIKYGKISSCPRSHQGSTDIRMALGWNCIQKDYGHFGLNILTALPAGTRPNSEFFFEPILGNGKHVELGLGFDGHILLWENGGTQDLILYGGANLTHLFKTRQRRSFDLRRHCEIPHDNKALSRYMLLKEFDEQGNYTNKLTPVINHTTLPCNASIDIQTDLVLMFEYTHNSFLLDIGYNGFIRSKEKICLRNQGIPSRTFGLKGIQDVAIPLGAPSDITQSTATIFGNELDQQDLVANPNSPVFISTDDINTSSAASPRLITHKLFTHIGYTCCTNSDYQPFFGIGAEIEFEGINPRNRTQPVHDTASMWGIWLKAGVAL